MGQAASGSGGKIRWMWSFIFRPRFADTTFNIRDSKQYIRRGGKEARITKKARGKLEEELHTLNVFSKRLKTSWREAWDVSERRQNKNTESPLFSCNQPQRDKQKGGPYHTRKSHESCLTICFLVAVFILKGMSSFHTQPWLNHVNQTWLFWRFQVEHIQALHFKKLNCCIFLATAKLLFLLSAWTRRAPVESRPRPAVLWRLGFWQMGFRGSTCTLACAKPLRINTSLELSAARPHTCWSRQH